ncbi:MAG: ROK family protein [Fimbriimonadaceae bacterium]|nr:ROK family protein [Fimbriimonadaceae bacterium]
MRNCNSTALNGKPLHADLERLLDVEIALANDANCFALAEARFGAARDHRVVFGVIMGTGVGGGIVVDGHVLTGPNGIAGEWGHVPLPGVTDPRPCYCGKSGCVETVISGPAIEREFLQRTGRRLTLKQIVADPVSSDTLESLYSNFGRALAVVINLLDPDAIVLGGGVGNVEGLYTRGRTEVARHVFHPDFRTPILRPELGDSAGVIGAALL